MKESIDQLIKESLQQHEMPYNEAAWTSMQAKLDAKAPASAPRSGNWKYYGAAGIAALTVASYFFFQEGENDASATHSAQTEQVTTESDEGTVSSNAVASNEGNEVQQTATSNDEQSSSATKRF